MGLKALKLALGPLGSTSSATAPSDAAVVISGLSAGTPLMHHMDAHNCPSASTLVPASVTMASAAATLPVQVLRADQAIDFASSAPSSLQPRRTSSKAYWPSVSQHYTLDQGAVQTDTTT